jgi:hypothetical protein
LWRRPWPKLGCGAKERRKEERKNRPLGRFKKMKKVRN